jgi:alpha-glucosidase
MLPLLKELRSLLDSYPERYSVGETYLVTLQKTVSYCGPDKLHAAFSFDFTSNGLFFPWNPGWIKGQIARREQSFNAAGIWPTTVMSNHDLPRAASRYSKGEGDAHTRIAMALLLTLRGTPFMYYGEEIGMRDIALRRGEITDPPGRKYWPIYQGRDGCRSPMQWDDGKNAGFSAARPWLPVHPDYLQRNVAAQAADQDSLFQFTKKLLSLRKTYPALQRGDYNPLESPPGTLAYLRRMPEQSILVAVNFKSRPTNFVLPQGKWHILFSSNKGKSEATNPLSPYEVRLLILE